MSNSELSDNKMSESKKPDYLEVDEAIPGQNYVCLSFLSPESLMQNKEAFKCVKFLQSYCKDQKLKFEDVYSKYQDFTYKYEDKLQRDFDEQNDFQTSVRGLKVRGVFDTRQAAEDRAKKLSLRDSGFHTFVGQVGYWLPWDPNADKVADEVFQNSQLNDMMEKYQENNVNRDMFYEEQKRDKIKAAQEEVRKAKEEEAAKKALEEKDASEEYPIENTNGEVTDTEVTPETTAASASEAAAEAEAGEAASEAAGAASEAEPKKGSEVSKDIKDSLESDDPWMQRKR
tara:strand:+ start:7387 stop:8244 length:858 start_codon:yes stop_codon:yes gene_type:complete